METIDEYVAGCPEPVRPVLEEIRRRVHAAVPGAGETIRYSMPTMTLDGSSLVHFAAWKKHVAVYPAPEPGEDAEFERAIAPHRGDKGTLRFPLDQPIPYELIDRVVDHLVRQRG